MRLDEATGIKTEPATDLMLEAARFGNAEMQLVLSNSDLFRVGVEYEFSYYRGNDYAQHVVKKVLNPENTPKHDPHSTIMYAQKDIINSLPRNQMRHIANIVGDVSVEQGVEVITKPLSLRDTLTFMKHMFEFIDKSELSKTNQTTGLHVNVSLDGFSKNTFNATKALVLLDPDFFSGIDKYPVRNTWVENITKELGNTEVLLGLASTYRNSGVKAFIQTFEKLISKLAVKESSISLDYFLRNDIKQKERRIEFRFFGGTGYERRYTEIVNDIINVCFVMLCGGSGMLQKEYHRGIIRLLDRAVTRSKDFNGNRFADVLDSVRRR